MDKKKSAFVFVTLLGVLPLFSAGDCLSATDTRLTAVLPYTNAGYILKSNDPIWSKIDDPQSIIDLIGKENWTGAIYLGEPTGGGGTYQAYCELMGEVQVIPSSARLRHYYRCDSDIGSYYWRADDYQIRGPAPNDCAGIPEKVMRLKEILPNTSSGYKMITRGPIWSEVDDPQKIIDQVGEENWTGAIYIGELSGAGGTEKKSCESKGKLEVLWASIHRAWFLRQYYGCDCNVGTWYWKADDYYIKGPAPYDGNQDNDGDGVPDEDDEDPNDPTKGNYDIAKNLGSIHGPCFIRPMTKNPINFSTGNKVLKEDDLALPGPGIPLSFTRYYNSQKEEVGSIGSGWTGTFSEHVILWNSKPVLIEEDGLEVHFKNIGQGQYISEVDQVRIIESAEEGYRLFEPYGKVFSFNNEGKLTQVIDRNENSQTLDYINGRLSVVEDNYGRRLEFIYDSEGFLSILRTPIGEFNYEYDPLGNLTRVTKPDTSERTYFYNDPNDPNNLTGIVNENGIQSSNFVYDNQDRAIVSELAEGMHRVEVEYDTGTSRRVTDSFGNTTQFRLKLSRGIARIKSASGPGCGSCLNSSDTEYRLDSRFLIERSVDSMGYITAYTYEERGNMLTKTEALGTPEERTTIYTYHPEFNLITSITRVSTSYPGKTTKISFVYDDHGNLIEKNEEGFSANDPIARSTTYGYNDLGQLIFIDGPRVDLEDVTTFEYYPNEPSQGLNRGMLKKIVNALGHETFFSNYNAFGKPGETRDPNGILTNYIYDVAGRLVSKTTDGKTISFEYDWIGNLTSLHLPEGRRINYAYTSTNLLEMIEGGSGNWIQYFYDTEGNRTREEIHDQSGVLMKYSDFEFDPNNRLQRIIFPDGLFAERGYDETGNLISVTSPNGVTTSYDYDSLNRLRRVTEPGETVTQYAYDGHDNLTSVVDAEKNTTSYLYDDFGRLIRTDSPDTNITSYHYDEADNLISKTDAMGIQTAYQYDALNRLTEIQYPDSSQNVTYIYDEFSNGLGRLTGMIDPSGGYSNQYDAEGRLVRESSIISGLRFDMAYEYNDNGEILSVTYPSGRVIKYNRDITGRITDIWSNLEGVMTNLNQKTQYASFGPIIGSTYGNGIELNKTFDQYYRLKTIDAEHILNLEYSFDPDGNIEEIINNLDLALNQVFRYNDLHQLTSAEGKYGPITYMYDKAGNRLNRTLENETENFSYTPGSNLIKSMSGVETTVFNHDPNGNTIQMREMVLDYGEDNRLNKVVVEGTELSQYVYNGRGQRVIKHKADGSVIYLYDAGGNLIAEMGEQGNLIKDYVYLGSEPLAMFVPENVEEPNQGIDYLLKGRNWRTGQKITLQLDMEERTIFFEQDGGFSERFKIEDNKWKIHKSRFGKNRRVHFSYFRPRSFQMEGHLWFLGKKAYGSLHIKEYGHKKKSFYTIKGERVLQDEKKGEQVYYFHNDHLGTPQTLTDKDGIQVWAADYLPFGKAVVDEDPDGDGRKVTLNFRFPGQYYDSETGLHYNYHRYYDPDTGRYMTPDPIGLLGGVNLFAYSENNPINWVDFFGLKVLNPDNHPISPEVLNKLEGFNEYIGKDKDIVITGGNRSPDTDIGTGSRSTHVRGIAADIKVPGQPQLKTANQAAGSALFGGVGWYEEGYYDPKTKAGPHVHVDLREGTARWGYDKYGRYYKGYFPKYEEKFCE